MNKDELFKQLAQWGTDFSPQMVQGTQALFAPLILRPDESLVERDIAYGEHERHRLDIFGLSKNEGRNTNAPVLLFVHGGGFVMGDKGAPDRPFYNNIGAWAMEQRFVGVNITYRLAPDHPWPAGRDDVIAAVQWLVKNIAAYGGDPERIFIMGQSAGAVHVADTIAQPRNSAKHIRGALMISGIYAVEHASRDQFQTAYYGADESRYASCSSLPQLVKSTIPCLFSVNEHDPFDFQQQAFLLLEAWLKENHRWPQMHWLRGQNHYSSVAQIGSPFDTLGALVKDFIDRNL